MKRILLLSGGMDSIALLYWQRPSLAITIDYGQRPAEAEISAAAAVCEATQTPHEIIRADCSEIGLGLMRANSEQVPEELSKIVPPEWWPFRNQLLITLAASRAIRHSADRLVIGTVASDACHGDGTRAFVEATDRLLCLQEGAIGLEAPALKISSVDLIRRSGVPKSILAWAHSCHTSSHACGQCRGCIKYQEVLDALP